MRDGVVEPVDQVCSCPPPVIREPLHLTLQVSEKAGLDLSIFLKDLRGFLRRSLGREIVFREGRVVFSEFPQPVDEVRVFERFQEVTLAIPEQGKLEFFTALDRGQFSREALGDGHDSPHVGPALGRLTHRLKFLSVRIAQGGGDDKGL